MGAVVPAAPVTLHQRALDLFARVWQAKYGVAYSPSAADRSQLGLFLRHLDKALLPELPRAFERYLEDASPFVMDTQRHNLKWFLTSNGFTKYRTPEVMVVSQREVDNHRAGEQWLAMEAARNGHGRR